MNVLKDAQMLTMLASIFGVLIFATIITFFVNLNGKSAKIAPLLANLNARMRAWWFLISAFAISVLLGGTSAIITFAVVSVVALREFLSLSQTRESDHRALIWAFFVVLPINYLLIALRWYDLFVVFVPICAFIWIPLRCALSGDSKNFFARAAEIQWGLMLCIYFVSYVPAVLNLSVAGNEFQAVRLLCFLVFITQFCDVMQYVFGKIFGKHKIVPNISPNKTVEGFIGGMAAAVVLGTCLAPLTPFNAWQAALMSLIIGLTGFGGGVVMSAIKRDCNVKDYGAIIPGHGGMMDRVDSLCFAAPVFYHLTRMFFAV